MAKQLRIAKLIHLALLMGLLLAYFILGNLDNIIPSAIDTKSIVYVLIPIGAIFGSLFIFKNLVSKIDPKLPIEEKIMPYQSALIVRWAILEGAAFVILFLKPDFILFGFLIIIYFMTLRPTQQKVENDLNLVK